jgi:hypothetical protein
MKIFKPFDFESHFLEPKFGKQFHSYLLESGPKNFLVAHLIFIILSRAGPIVQPTS